MAGVEVKKRKKLDPNLPPPMSPAFRRRIDSAERAKRRVSEEVVNQNIVNGVSGVRGIMKSRRGTKH